MLPDNEIPGLRRSDCTSMVSQFNYFKQQRGKWIVNKTLVCQDKFVEYYSSYSLCVFCPPMHVCDLHLETIKCPLYIAVCI